MPSCKQQTLTSKKTWTGQSRLFFGSRKKEDDDEEIRTIYQRKWTFPKSFLFLSGSAAVPSIQSNICHSTCVVLVLLPYSTYASVCLDVGLTPLGSYSIWTLLTLSNQDPDDEPESDLLREIIISKFFTITSRFSQIDGPISWDEPRILFRHVFSTFVTRFEYLCIYCQFSLDIEETFTLPL